jgi:hypothetical protein
MSGGGRGEYGAESFRDAVRGSEELTGGVLLLTGAMVMLYCLKGAYG